jgi:hypothetical protein
MKEAPGSSETSVLTRATRRNNPEDTILPISLNSLSEISVPRQALLVSPIVKFRELARWALLRELDTITLYKSLLLLGFGVKKGRNNVVSETELLHVTIVILFVASFRVGGSTMRVDQAQNQGDAA